MELFAQEVMIHGAPLYVEACGDGAPVLLIHAGVADRRMWDAQWQTLRDSCRLIRFDMRGWGRSTPIDGPFTHHDDVSGVLDYFGIESAHIVGVSFGGRVALDFALAYPERVRSLVLGAPSVGGAGTSPDIDAFGEQEEALIDAGDLDAAAQLNVDFWVVGPTRSADQVAAHVRDAVLTMQRDAFDVPLPAGFAPSGLTPPAIGRLADITAPALVLVGDADVQHVQLLAHTVADAIPQGRLVVRQNVGHMVTMERAHEIDSLLREWVSSY